MVDLQYTHIHTIQLLTFEHHSSPSKQLYSFLAILMSHTEAPIIHHIRGHCHHKLKQVTEGTTVFNCEKITSTH